MRLSTSLSLLLVLLPCSASFAPLLAKKQHHQQHHQHQQQALGNINNKGAAVAAASSFSSSRMSSWSLTDQEDNSSSSSSSSSNNNIHMRDKNNTSVETMLLEQGGLIAPKLSFRSPLPEERGKGGVHAKESIAALEIIARIPRSLIVATCDSSPRAMAATTEVKQFSWAADLTAATLSALFPDPADGSTNNNGNNSDDLRSATTTAAAKQSWIASWKEGGWGTNGADLGPPEADWGVKCVTGSLLATGSDNDKNVFSKFRFPCHPVVHRAGLGLALLTEADKQESLDALLLRGKTYRSMKDALLPLVTTPSEERKGSLRERRAWDVADVLSKVLSRATTLQLVVQEETNNRKDDGVAPVDVCCIVPVHERLAHCDGQGENSKLVASSSGDDDDNETDEMVLLVATREIQAGEAITRDYAMAPQLDSDTSDGALRLLLQFGLPPSAWATTDC